MTMENDEFIVMINGDLGIKIWLCCVLCVQIA